MRVAALLALVVLCAGQEEDACVADVGRADASGRGLLQLKRLREELAAGAGVADRQSLLEMKSQLASKLDRREEIKENERGFLQDFEKYIINTSLKYIKAGAKKDQEDVNEIVDEIRKCEKQLATDEENGPWRAKKAYMLEKKKAHKTCRDEEVPVWNEPNRTCKTLNTWVAGHVEPGVEHGYGLPSGATRAQVVEWLKNFWVWHCRDKPKADDFEDKTKECSDDMTDAINKHEKCNEIQAEFEKSFCEFRTEVLAGCHEYTTCRSDTDTRYEKTVTRLTIIDKDRKVECQILHVIICYIKLLLGPKAQITDEAKTACETTYPPFPEDSSIVLPMTVDNKYVWGQNLTECTTKVPEKVEPYPCQQAWIDEHYADIPKKAPPTHCSHSCVAQVQAVHPCETAGNGGCEQICEKNGDQAKCACSAGYKLRADAKTCGPQ